MTLEVGDFPPDGLLRLALAYRPEVDFGKGLDQVGGADGLQFATVLCKPRLLCRRILVGAEKRVGEDAEVL